jgi:hypothetical protein
MWKFLRRPGRPKPIAPLAGMSALEIDRVVLERDLRSDFARDLQTRLDRWYELNHMRFIPAQYFSEASSECLYLYRDGYFLSCVLLCQAVCEGIIKFVADCNGRKKDAGWAIPDVLRLMVENQEVSAQLESDALGIYGSYRNDFHHLNPAVAKLDVREIAVENIHRLQRIEREIFGFTTPGGKIQPAQPKYWDVKEDGTVSVFIRCQ